MDTKGLQIGCQGYTGGLGSGFMRIHKLMLSLSESLNTTGCRCENKLKTCAKTSGRSQSSFPCNWSRAR